MSKTLFTENSFSVLGLDSSSPEKEIVKRSREIENLLKIDVVPDYEVDFSFSKDSRTEPKVKKAVEKLISPDKKIIESFFWVTIKDSIDERAMKLFRDGDVVGAIELYESKLSSSPNNFFAWRNKAVLESIVFSEKAQNKYLEESLKSWKTVISSDKQWTDFKKIYLLNNPDVGDKIFEDFKKNAAKILSGFYESMSNIEGKPEIYAAFSKRFSVHSEVFDRNTLDPLLNRLNEATSRLRKYTLDFIEYGEDNKHLSQESCIVIGKAKDEMDHVTDQVQALGDVIWNSTKVKIVRDECAMALRNKAIDIVNNSSIDKHSNDLSIADNLLSSAYNICSDDSAVEKKILQDKEDFKEIRKGVKYAKKVEEVKPKLDRIVYYIKTQRFDEAIDLIDECLELGLNAVDEKFLKETRAKCVEAANRKDAETAKSIISVIIIIAIIIFFIVMANVF